MNKRMIAIIVVIFTLLLTACASTGSGSGTGLSLLEAVEQASERIAGELPAGSRVAVVAFESDSGNLSDFIMEELVGALFDRKIEVADRQNLEYVFKELNFQMSGVVSDDSAQSIGKFLAAELVVTGQMRNLGSTYRFTTNAIRVETAIHASIPRLMVRNDQEFKSMAEALANQKTVIRTAKYGVSENVTPQTAGTFLDRGILFASRGDYEMAIADFTEAIRLNPNMASAYMLRARAIYASVSNITNVSENFSGVGSTITKEGQLSAGQIAAYNRAIEDLTQVIRLEPDNAKAYVERGRVNADKADYDRAIADYNQAIRINPDYSDAYNNRGVVYVSKGDLDRAIEDYTHAIRLSPNIFGGYSNRANAYVNRGLANRDYETGQGGDFDRAIADSTQAIRLDPNQYLGYLQRGYAYNGKGDYDRAIADFTQAIRLDPNPTGSYFNRGLSYFAKEDYDRAIADFESYLRLKPGDDMVQQMLNEARRRRGR